MEAEKCSNAVLLFIYIVKTKAGHLLPITISSISIINSD